MDYYFHIKSIEILIMCYKDIEKLKNTAVFFILAIIMW